MNPAHPARPFHRVSRIGSERLFLGLFLVSLLLLVAILGSFHHHHDLPHLPGEYRGLARTEQRRGVEHDHTVTISRR